MQKGLDAKNAMIMLERASYSPHKMTFKEMRNARSLRARLLRSAKPVPSAEFSTSISRGGALDAVRGNLNPLSSSTEESGEKNSSNNAEPCPRATSERGLLVITSTDLPTSTMKAYGVVGDDGKLRFFDDYKNAEEYFADPSSTRAAGLVRGILDLASVASMTRPQDGSGIKICTPTTTYTITPDSSDLLETLHKSFYAIVSAFHQALARMFGPD